MRITELFTAQSIALDEALQTQEQILSRLVELQATHGNITDKDAYKKALYAREAEGSTYVDNGITVPHAKTDVVTRPSLAALRLAKPVQYNAEDDGTTDLLFAIAAPENGSLLSALNAAGDGLWDWNMETNTIYYSPRYTAMLGYDRSTFGNTFESWRDKLHPDERPAILKRQMDIIMSPRYGDSYEHSFRMRKADGTYCWILSRARVLRRNAHGRATRLIGLHTDITTTQGERDRLAEMIEYDPLTDVHSLVYFHNELDRLDMQPDKVVSIISCDVNGLKLINDYLGHDTGNSMLQTAARLLRSSLRSTDCVARLGGDEFAVLLPWCNLRDAARVLEKIRAVFRHYNEHSGNVPVIMSFGLSGAEEAPSLREALALADRRMLHEKHGSRLVSGHAIKAWIEKRKDCVVSLEESRYDG